MVAICMIEWRCHRANATDCRADATATATATTTTTRGLTAGINESAQHCDQVIRAAGWWSLQWDRALARIQITPPAARNINQQQRPDLAALDCFGLVRQPCCELLNEDNEPAQGEKLTHPLFPRHALRPLVLQSLRFRLSILLEADNKRQNSPIQGERERERDLRGKICRNVIVANSKVFTV